MAMIRFIVFVLIFGNLVACDTTVVVEEVCPGHKGDPGENGIDGEDGLTGPAGSQGPQGDPGENGGSCTVVDNGDGTGTMTCPDGSSVTVLIADEGDDDEQEENSCKPVVHAMNSWFDVEPFVAQSSYFSTLVYLSFQGECGKGQILSAIYMEWHGIPGLVAGEQLPWAYSNYNVDEDRCVVRPQDPNEPSIYWAFCPGAGEIISPTDSVVIQAFIQEIPYTTAEQAANVWMNLYVELQDLETGTQHMVSFNFPSQNDRN